ncbi:hypothetical protein MRX96_006015 [Rhipicephalus microplus]
MGTCSLGAAAGCCCFRVVRKNSEWSRGGWSIASVWCGRKWHGGTCISFFSGSKRRCSECHGGSKGLSEAHIDCNCVGDAKHF